MEDHPLTRELAGREQELGSVGWGELAREDQVGQPLLRVAGKVVAAVRGNRVQLCVDLNRWQAGPASFPIFWMNVVDFAHRVSPGWTVLRTGQPVQVPPQTHVLGSPSASFWSLTPEGRFLPHSVGAYRLQGSDRESPLYVNLLDERESDTAGVSRDLDWDPGAAAGRVPRRRDLSAAAAWSALVFLVLAWLLQLRAE